jgi:hypothetical protein
VDPSAALHASTFSAGRGGGLLLAAEMAPDDIYRDFFNCSSRVGPQWVVGFRALSLN